METDEKRQRKGFVDDHASGQWSMTELCERYGISRPTGYELGIGADLPAERYPRSRNRPSNSPCCAS